MKKVLCISLMFIILNLLSINAFAVEYMIPEDALEYDGHYYRLYDLECGWEEAREYCENVSGHLVSITSQEEQTVIENLINTGTKNSYWMGGYRNSSGDWEWITDETFLYTNWSSSQPDNYTGTENALMLYRSLNPKITCQYGQWNDVNFDGTCDNEDFFGISNFGFICEWDPQPVMDNSNEESQPDFHDSTIPSAVPAEPSDHRTSNSMNAESIQEGEKNTKHTSDNVINITFHVDNLSVFGGLSIIGGLSILGGIHIVESIIRKCKGR